MRVNERGIQIIATVQMKNVKQFDFRTATEALSGMNFGKVHASSMDDALACFVLMEIFSNSHQNTKAFPPPSHDNNSFFIHVG